jgi:hypothetical protein
VLIIDDVISAGTSVREAVGIIRSAGAQPAGIAIALDRQERGSGSRSAAQEVNAEYGIPCIAIAGLDDLIHHLAERPGVEVDMEAQRRLTEDLQASASEVAELNEELAFYRRIMAPADGQDGLRVQAFEVSPATENGLYRVKLVLVQARQRDARTSGELDVELRGTRGGQEARLSLADVAPGSHAFDFRYFQDIDLELAVPADFRPETAMVVLTPKGRNAVPVSATFPWPPGN